MYYLRPLSKESLSLVRAWRNAPHVRDYMFYTKHITASAHAAWFKTIREKGDLYYLYICENTPVGLVNLKNIDHQQRSAEAGMFCGDHDYTGHYINVLAPMKLYQYAFQELGMVTIYATVKSHNSKVIEFNKRLGFQIDAFQNEAILMSLMKPKFDERTVAFRKLLSKIQISQC